YDWAPVSLSIGGGEPVVVFGQMASGNYFSLLGVHAALGRTFSPEEDREGAGRPVVVLSDHLFRERLDGDRRVLGRTILLNSHPFTVIGVAPPEFTGLDVGARPELWVPMAVNAQIRTDPNVNWYGKRRGLSISAVGRLKPGVSFAQAQAEAAALSQRFERDYPVDNKGRGFTLLPLAQAAVGPNERQGIVAASGLLLTVVGLVLLIACANVANLLLARAAARRKEIAIRLSVGAGRGRLLRQLLTESLLLALLGGAAGLLLASFADRLVLRLLPSLPLTVSPALNLGIDGRLLLFTLGLSLATGVLFGLAPALETSRPGLVVALKSQAAPAGSGGRRLAGRNLLVAGQVALSLVALIAAGLFLRSLSEAQHIDPGFAADRLLRVRCNLGLQGYDGTRAEAFERDSIERLSAIPGVAAATLAQAGPFQGALARSVFVDGRETSSDGTLIQANGVGPRYFETLGVPLLAGRELTEADRAGAPVAVINQFMAEKFFPGENPVGQRFRFFGETRPIEIVGVARNAKYFSLSEPPQPYIYLPLPHRYVGGLTLLVRAASDPAAILPTAERQVRDLDKQLPLTGVATLRQVISDDLWAPRLGAGLLGLFGALALLLAAVGLYGVMSFSVAQREREIGVRMALGARPGEVVGLVLFQGMGIVALGLAAGLIIAFAASHLAATLLYGVSPTDPLAFSLTSVLLALVGLASTFLPARRATAVDPMLVLRQE
ncbi:MAG TPA: ADOP family duplicated permease, partial [Thermoanaerobaculia bacterium]|nr:ADOP family duplicated permease [Thermoanaerobaculia bacterium]